MMVFGVTFSVPLKMSDFGQENCRTRVPLWKVYRSLLQSACRWLQPVRHFPALAGGTQIKVVRQILVIRGSA